MVCYQTCILVLAVVTNEYTEFLLWEYGLKVCVVSFGYWSSCLKVYIYLRCINTHRWTTTPFYLWFPSSQVRLICWYYTNMMLRFVSYCLVFIQLIINCISIYLASTNSNEKHHHSISHTSYNLATAKLRDCIRV